jgi:hypothetical protein
MANADAPSSFVEYPNNGKSRPVFAGIVDRHVRHGEVTERPATELTYRIPHYLATVYLSAGGMAVIGFGCVALFSS